MRNAGVLLLPTRENTQFELQKETVISDETEVGHVGLLATNAVLTCWQITDVSDELTASVVKASVRHVPAGDCRGFLPRLKNLECHIKVTQFVNGREVPIGCAVRQKAGPTRSHDRAQPVPVSVEGRAMKGG